VVLWEGRHVAISHGGSVPLDPVGIAITLFDAASNVLGEEQILRVTDDLSRRLVSTIPDSKVTALEDPAPVEAVKAPPPPSPAPLDPVAEAERLLAQGDHAGARAAADKALAADPNRADAWFMKARLAILERDYAQAEPAILKAVAHDRGNARYLNALGVVNAEKGLPERALAAYRMAIDAEAGNGFAWYNTGVLLINAGNPAEAADAFYGAGLAYIKAGDYAKAERALSELKDLGNAGIPAGPQIKTIEDALSDLTRRKS
jgi:tetratricopeptide (TPR) repeat protein